MRPTDRNLMNPTSPCGQVFPGLPELRTLCARQAHPKFDFSLLNCGTLAILTANTRAARVWVEEHLPIDRPRWGRDGSIIEHRYVQHIVDGLEADGYSVGV